MYVLFQKRPTVAVPLVGFESTYQQLRRLCRYPVTGQGQTKVLKQESTVSDASTGSDVSADLATMDTSACCDIVRYITTGDAPTGGHFSADVTALHGTASFNVPGDATGNLHRTIVNPDRPGVAFDRDRRTFNVSTNDRTIDNDTAIHDVHTGTISDFDRIAVDRDTHQISEASRCLV